MTAPNRQDHSVTCGNTIIINAYDKSGNPVEHFVHAGNQPVTPSAPQTQPSSQPPTQPPEPERVTLPTHIDVRPDHVAYVSFTSMPERPDEVMLAIPRAALGRGIAHKHGMVRFFRGATKPMPDGSPDMIVFGISEPEQ